MNQRLLVAGVGNIFLGDDGFGSEVTRRLAVTELPDWVRVVDFGIRGVHLAYELLDGYDRTILVDATPRGGAPGTVYVIEPGAAGEDPAPPDALAALGLIDAHGMEPVSVFALLRALGGRLGRVLVVGCEPAEIEERIGLSEPVACAVDEAVRVVCELIAEASGEIAAGEGGRAEGKRGEGG